MGGQGGPSAGGGGGGVQLRIVRGISEPDWEWYLFLAERIVVLSFRGKEEFVAVNLPYVIQAEPDAGWLGRSQLLEAQVLLRTGQLRPGCSHMFETLSLIT